MDRLEGNRIKLTEQDSGMGSHAGDHHYISLALVAEVEGDKVRLSANADVAVSFEEEADGHSETGRGTQTSASAKPADGTVFLLNLGPVL